MKLVVIFGAGAVGKMTVGQELAKRTALRLYHGHMDIEMVIEIFGERNPSAGIRIREVIFEEFAKTDLYGMIFTFMWALDRPEEWEYIGGLVDIFESKGADIYYVELVASQEIRLQRHVTENRLKHKASKRNIEWSTNLLLNEDKKFRLASNDGEIPFENYIKIDNSDLSPQEVVDIIKEKFGLL
jgi:hypothetical protein